MQSISVSLFSFRSYKTADISNVLLHVRFIENESAQIQTKNYAKNKEENGQQDSIQLISTFCMRKSGLPPAYHNMGSTPQFIKIRNSPSRFYMFRNTQITIKNHIKAHSLMSTSRNNEK